MGRKAKPSEIKVPGNVSVEYITPAEREQRIAAAPPGAGATNAAQPPGTIVTHHMAPPLDEQQAQDVADQVIGRAAIVCARKLGVDYVWSTQSKKKITLDSAEQVCKKNPGLIYFDFDSLEEVAADAEKALQSETLEVEYNDQIDGTETEGFDGLNEIQPIENEVVDDEVAYMAEQPNREALIAEAREAAKEAEQLERLTDLQTAEQRRVSETERRAWGGTLSAPGIQVYMHPNGIARVDVEGPVRIQKGITGTVRTLRIQRLAEPNAGGTVKNVTHKTVTGSQARSPNPNAQFRQHAQFQKVEAPKIPIPVPPETDYEEDTDY